jgi:hypothetical protein
MIAPVISIQGFLRKHTMWRKKRKSFNSGQYKITNLEYLNKFCDGNTARMENYISIFQDTTPPLIMSLEVALSDNDPKEIFRLLYSCKMKWIMMGMDKTEKLSARIINHCQHTTNLAGEQQSIRQLINELSIAMAELDRITEKKIK